MGIFTKPIEEVETILKKAVIRNKINGGEFSNENLNISKGVANVDAPTHNALIALKTYSNLAIYDNRYSEKKSFTKADIKKIGDIYGMFIGKIIDSYLNPTQKNEPGYKSSISFFNNPLLNGIIKKGTSFYSEMGDNNKALRLRISHGTPLQENKRERIFLDGISCGYSDDPLTVLSNIATTLGSGYIGKKGGVLDVVFVEATGGEEPKKYEIKLDPQSFNNFSAIEIFKDSGLLNRIETKIEDIGLDFSKKVVLPLIKEEYDMVSGIDCMVYDLDEKGGLTFNREVYMSIYESDMYKKIVDELNLFGELKSQKDEQIIDGDLKALKERAKDGKNREVKNMER